MTDTRVRVPLNGKQVNLAQLDIELGHHGLCASDTEVVAVEGSALTREDLQAAVDAHVADPAWVNPANTTAVNRKTLQDRAGAALTANANFLAITSPTNADVVKQVRLLTREATALIRLLLRKLDTVEGT